MKNRLLSILFVLLAGTGAVFAQSEVTPPAFNGAVIRVFMTRMAATVEKIAIEQQIPADSISPVVGIVLQIDKAGNVAEWRYMDNTQAVSYTHLARHSERSGADCGKSLRDGGLSARDVPGPCRRERENVRQRRTQAGAKKRQAPEKLMKT